MKVDYLTNNNEQVRFVSKLLKKWKSKIKRTTQQTKYKSKHIFIKKNYGIYYDVV